MQALPMSIIACRGASNIICCEGICVATSRLVPDIVHGSSVQASSLFVPVSVRQASASASKGLCLTCQPVFGTTVRTPPGCPTASREAAPNTRHEPSRGQVHPISNDTQLALQSVCAARKVLILHAAHKLLVCRNEGAFSLATRQITCVGSGMLQDALGFCGATWPRSFED